MTEKDRQRALRKFKAASVVEVKRPVQIEGWNYDLADYGIRTFYVNGCAVYYERLVE